MSDKTVDTGGPAFPSDEYEINEGHWEGRYQVRQQFSGMSLRDWFAGQAAIGMGDLTSWTESMSGIRHLWSPRDVAVRAYAIADALLAERKKALL